MASSVPLQFAETVQTAFLVRNPSAAHDINPSTAATKREPVRLEEKPREGHHDDEIYVDYDDDDYDDDEIPVSILRPKRRAPSFVPLPDLRFEQSYLRSIADADTWWKIAWITVRDQVMMPLAQGIVYNLAIGGWQYWNRNAQLSGNSIGARVRRWWYGVNNWPIPSEKLRRRI